jgi:hypothetical protein
MVAKENQKVKLDFMTDIDMPCDKFINAFQKNLRCNYQYTSSTLQKGPHAYLSHSTRRTPYPVGRALIQAIPERIFWKAQPITSEKTRLCAKFSLSKLTRFSTLLMIISTNVAFCFLNIALFRNSSKAHIYLLLGLQSTVCLLFLIAMGLLSNRYRNFLQTVIKQSIGDEYRITWHASIASDPRFRSLVAPDLYWFAAIIYFVAIGIYYNSGVMAIITIPRNVLIPVLAVVISAPLLLFFTSRHLSGIVHSTRFMPIFLTFSLAIAFIFSMHCPLTLTKGMTESFVEHINGLPIDDIIDVSDHYYESTKKFLIASNVNRFMGRYFMLHVMTYLICLLLLYRNGHRLSGYIGGRQSTQQKQLKQLIEDRKGISLALSATAKLCVLCMFIFLSVTLWKCIVTYAAIVNSCVAPGCRLIQNSDSEAIMDATNTITRMAVTNLPNNQTEESIRIRLLLPVVIPPTIFIYLHVRSAWRKTRKKYVPLDESHAVAKQAKTIALKMLLSPVSVLIDKKSDKTEIRSQFGGWLPRNRIILSQKGVSFLVEHSDFIEPILAHEVAHLKHDCKKFWLTEGLSRIGLVGPAFLSVLHNSAAIEGRAHKTALAYVKGRGSDEKLFEQATYLIGLQEYNDLLDGRTRQSSSSLTIVVLNRSGRTIVSILRFLKTGANRLLKRISKYWPHSESTLSLSDLSEVHEEARRIVLEVIPKYWHTAVTTIRNRTLSFRLIVKFYFDLDWYDYVHGNQNMSIRGKTQEQTGEPAATTRGKED